MTTRLRNILEAAVPRALVALVVSSGLCAGTRAWAAPPAFIQVTTSNLSLVPSPQDYVNDYVDATGPAGIEVKVKTGDPAGLILKVRSSGAGNTIRLGDLLVCTRTPPGPGGVALVHWTPLALTDLNLWSIGQAQGPFAFINTDIRVVNLGGYEDGAGGAFTSFTHTLVFTVISP